MTFMQMCEAAPGQPPLLERAARMWLHSAKLPTRALPYARKLAATCPESHTALQLLGEALLCVWGYMHFYLTAMQHPTLPCLAYTFSAS